MFKPDRVIDMNSRLTDAKGAFAKYWCESGEEFSLSIVLLLKSPNYIHSDSMFY